MKATERLPFDLRVAQEVMGWKLLDETLMEDFHKHTLPETAYPFITIQNNHILLYHPTPYHTTEFSPSKNHEDDSAVMLYFIAKQPESVVAFTTLVHFIQHQRSLENIGFRPADSFYLNSNEYMSGDFSNAILHLNKTELSEINLSFSQALLNIDKKYIETYGISSVEIANNKLVVYCETIPRRNICDEIADVIKQCLPNADVPWLFTRKI